MYEIYDLEGLRRTGGLPSLVAAIGAAAGHAANLGEPMEIRQRSKPIARVRMNGTETEVEWT